VTKHEDEAHVAENLEDLGGVVDVARRLVAPAGLALAMEELLEVVERELPDVATASARSTPRLRSPLTKKGLLSCSNIPIKNQVSPGQAIRVWQSRISRSSVVPLRGQPTMKTGGRSLVRRLSLP